MIFKSNRLPTLQYVKFQLTILFIFIYFFIFRDPSGETDSTSVSPAVRGRVPWTRPTETSAGRAA